MDLKHIFIKNLKKFRVENGLSQMKLAELCNTAPSYIGEIEIGRRFPSWKLIDKIGQILKIEPYRFFISNVCEKQDDLEEIINYLIKLSERERFYIINRLSAS